MTMNNSKETWSRNQNTRITWEGCSVLLDINDSDRVLFSRLTAGSKLKIGNKNCSLQPLIGCPFGSFFQVEVGDDGPFLSRIFTSSEDDTLQENIGSQIMEESRVNRAIVDNNTAQSLSGEDIEDMLRKSIGLSSKKNTHQGYFSDALLHEAYVKHTSRNRSILQETIGK
ncbi:uncharacterized protein [Primulina huaijiensis]